MPSRVTVTVEPWGIGRKLHYVARDDAGTWHTYGLVERKPPSMPVELWLFHEDEIAEVKENEKREMEIYLR